MLVPISKVFSGLTNASKRLENSANNVSNVLTSGFRKGQVNTVDNTEEMVDQIFTRATFKANTNVIKAKGEALGSLIDIKK